jgi:signal transduction histidine kinase
LTSLRLLLLEDNVLDAELSLAELEAAGFRCTWVRVDKEADFRAQLDAACPDLILADYSLPAFDGVSALDIARESCAHVPFIFVSGALGEELAIETLKRGATDYVLKHRLQRLGPSVRRALREAEDRSARAQLEEQLRQRADELAEAARRKDEFLAMLAHELRNPLAPILNALHLMGSPSDDPEMGERCRQLVERQTRHMARLLDDLLDISRITRGKILLRQETLDLAALVRETAEDHRNAVLQAGLSLVLSIPPESFWVYGDGTRLAQVIGNLLNNAVKFTPPGGRITVTVAKTSSGDAVYLSVTDTGIGIAPDALSQVFEPFVQEGRSQPTGGGLGLGLALVHGLVGLHGGTVRAHSEGPDRGTGIVLEVPLTNTPQLASEAPVTSPQVPERTTLRVLVIDDNVDAADTLAEVLALSGHEVEVAYSGPTGLAVARRQVPQVVLCDLGLPGMDGYEIAAALRKLPETEGSRIIAVSGYGQPDDRRRSQEAGFDLHLTKPVDPVELAQILG